MKLTSILPVIALTFAASTAHALCAAPEIQAGRYVNVDADTRSITTASVQFVCGATRTVNADGTTTIRHSADPHWRVALTGSCSPRDCAWGEVRGEARNGGVITATYEQGFADRRVRIQPRGDDILLEVTSRYDDGRADRVSRDRLRLENRVSVEPAPRIREDCVKHDPRGLAVRTIRGDVKITDGPHWLMSFRSNRSEAERTLGILRNYGATEVCYVGRPGPSLTYILKDGRAPTGAMTGEDCLRHDLDALALRREGTRYLMTDGRSRMVMFDGREEAETALATIRHHGFTHICYVGRPDPSFVYMRK